MGYHTTISGMVCGPSEQKKIDEEGYENRIYHIQTERSLADGFQPNLSSSAISRPN
jgi:hypothetical protein